MEGGGQCALAGMSGSSASASCSAVGLSAEEQAARSLWRLQRLE